MTKTNTRPKPKTILFDDLMAEVEHWIGATEPSWQTSRTTVMRDMTGSHKQVEIAELEIDTHNDDRKIYLQPVNVRRNGDQVVEMSGWPTLRRINLRREPGRSTWNFETRDGIDLRRAWTGAEFIDLARELMTTR